MKDILVDTSVWIDFFNGIPSREVDLLTEYIEIDYTVYICPVILQEVLQGFKSDSDYNITKGLLLAFPILEVDLVDSAIGAADIYRALRKKGKTIRKSNDCLIAYYAITHNLPVLQKDRDFPVMADHTNLEIVAC